MNIRDNKSINQNNKSKINLNNTSKWSNKINIFKIQCNSIKASKQISFL